MTEARRIVRATPSFFEDLDRQFPGERGPNGEPSATDFQVFELIRIVERFATGFDSLPELIPVFHDAQIFGRNAPTPVRRPTIIALDLYRNETDAISADLARRPINN